MTVTRKRTVTVNEEVFESEPAKAVISVALGSLTLASLAGAVGAIEQAAAAANAPVDAEIELDNYGSQVIARVRWELPS
jgi:hypothetical protein